jgi:hypothetical protein
MTYFSDRKKYYDKKWTYDLQSIKIDCPEILINIYLNVPSINLRSPSLLFAAEKLQSLLSSQPYATFMQILTEV